MTDRTTPATSGSGSPSCETAVDKVTLRDQMRTLRRSLPDRAERSSALWRHVTALPAVVSAETVLAFTTIAGEPEVEQLLVWCAATGRLVAAPEADVEPSWPDVVVVPGLAFTPAGDRLGQGGGWYDRFLACTRPDCTTVGVCFAEQVLDTVPVEAHDIVIDRVVADTGVVR